MKQSTLFKVCIVIIILAVGYLAQGQNQQRVPREKMKTLLPVIMIVQSDPDYKCQVNSRFDLDLPQFYQGGLTFKKALLHAEVFGSMEDKLEVIFNETIPINPYLDPRYSLESLQEGQKVALFYVVKEDAESKRKYLMLYCKPKSVS